MPLENKMPAVNLHRRCKPGDMGLIAQTPFNTWWWVQTTFPLHECINSEFFMNVRAGMRAGDNIRLLRYDNDKWKRVLEICDRICVKYVDSAGVELELLEPIRTDNRDGETGFVVDRGFDGGFAIRLDGTMYAKRNTIVEANELAVALGEEFRRPVKTLNLNPATGKPILKMPANA